MKKEIKVKETFVPIKKFKTGQIIVITSNELKGNKEGTITKVVKSASSKNLYLKNLGVLLAEARSSIQNSLENAVTVTTRHSYILCWYEVHVRPATEKEKRAYRKGIYSIYDM